MPKRTTPLNSTQIKNLKPQSTDYLLSDGNGLHLIVRKSGTKSFSFKYVQPQTGKRITLALGNFPHLSLAEARAKVSEMRKLLANEIDPVQQKIEIKESEKNRTDTTLLVVAKKWMEIKRTKVSLDYGDDIWRSLENHIFPELGHTPINEITAPKVIKSIQHISANGSLETVKRLCQRLNEIMVFAVNTGLIDHNRLAGVKCAFPPPKTKSFPTLTKEQLPEFLYRLKHANIFSLTRCLIEFQLHTLTRPCEGASAEWSEVSFEKRLWTIPAQKMKMNRDHVIPLSEEMIILLNYLKTFNIKSDYIFPAPRNRKTHLNSQTSNMAIKRMGYGGQLVAHGLRALGSTILNEQEFNGDWVEAALAHTDSNQIRAIYNRALYLDQRREMMQWWSDFLTNASKKLSPA